MRRAFILTTLIVLLINQRAWSREPKGNLDELAVRAISEDSQTAETAINRLRAHGPAGLDALFTVHAAAIRDAIENPAPTAKEQGSTYARIRHALDEVSGQRDAQAAHLFWYTDMSEAEAAARQARKPILSLRLLGKLTDEYSCANSRFFRSTLYANQEVSRILRERFVLHWQMVRPAPKMTIDFGDGRKLVRTVTGNSVHYVLSADGWPLDALPGLYGPQAFIRWLEKVDELSKTIAADRTHAQKSLADYHARRSAELRAAWQHDLEQLGISTEGDQANSLPSAKTSDEIWNRLAVLHAADAELDAASRHLIASHHPAASTAARVAAAKIVIEQPLVRLMRELQGAIALDTVRNEHLLHRRIHEMFAAGDVRNLNWLNKRVYADLFLTPSTDPWLGLLPAGYTGLENGGIIVPAAD